MERLDGAMRARSRAMDAIVLLAIALLIALAIVEVLASRASAGEASAKNVTAPWAPHIGRVDEALAQKNFSVAVRAWGDAYGAALGSRRWEGMIAVGDAYLRIGDRLAYRRAFVAKAREAYLAAVFRARHQRSLDGVLRAAEAFAALGDRQVVAQCLTIAKDLAGRDPKAQALVQEQASRFSDPSITAGTLRIEP